MSENFVDSLALYRTLLISFYLYFANNRTFKPH